MKSNNLLKRYQNVSAMKSIQGNQLLNVSNRKVQQSQQRCDPLRIREAILDQRKPDTKIDKTKFERIVNNLSNSIAPERARLWASRTNQPYKNIMPAKDIKKVYENKEELVVYRVRKEDKDEKEFKENVKKMKAAVIQHNNELKDTYAVSKKDDYKREFEYNNIEKYNVKYDPAEFKDMKENIVEYYKKEQLEAEKDKKCVDEIMMGMESMGLTDEIQTNATNDDKPEQKSEKESDPEPEIQKESPNEEKCEVGKSKMDKYKQRQKKV